MNTGIKKMNNDIHVHVQVADCINLRILSWKISDVCTRLNQVTHKLYIHVHVIQISDELTRDFIDILIN